MRTARNLLQDFREKRFLCDEVRESELLKVQRGEIVPTEGGYSAPLRNSGAGPRDGVTSNQARANDEEKVYALDELARIIDRMETEVSEEITKLDQKTSELIELVSGLYCLLEVINYAMTNLLIFFQGVQPGLYIRGSNIKINGYEYEKIELDYGMSEHKPSTTSRDTKKL